LRPRESRVPPDVLETLSGHGRVGRCFGPRARTWSKLGPVSVLLGWIWFAATTKSSIFRPTPCCSIAAMRSKCCGRGRLMNRLWLLRRRDPPRQGDDLIDRTATFLLPPNVRTTLPENFTKSVPSRRSTDWHASPMPGYWAMTSDRQTTLLHSCSPDTRAESVPLGSRDCASSSATRSITSCHFRSRGPGR
jgi:hypothetical protein